MVCVGGVVRSKYLPTSERAEDVGPELKRILTSGELNTMGWAANDKKTREDLEVQLSLTRREGYRLYRLIAQVEHDEKRRALESAYAKLNIELDSIAFTLSR